MSASNVVERKQFWFFKKGWFWDSNEWFISFYRLTIFVAIPTLLLEYVLKPMFFNIVLGIAGLAICFWLVWTIALPIALLGRVIIRVPKTVKAMRRKHRARAMRRYLKKRFGGNQYTEGQRQSFQCVVDAILEMKALTFDKACKFEIEAQTKIFSNLNAAIELVAEHKKDFWQTHEAFTDLGFAMKASYTDYLPKPISIVLTVRPTNRDDIHAAISTDNGIWGCGRTTSEAVGSVIAAHQKVFGIQTVWSEDEYTQRKLKQGR